jgi:hypothetical protein
MKWLFNFFKIKPYYTKEDVMSFAEYWHCKQSLFGYEGEKENLFIKWEANRLKK